VAAAGAVNLVNFEFRCDPVREELHRLLFDGAIGTPEHASWTHLSSGSRIPLRRHGWLFEAASGGGWIGAWGSHGVDALRWLLGEIESVSAERTLAVPERPDADGALHSCDTEDGFTARLGLTGGVTVAIDSTFAATATLAPRLVITGSEGVLECVADTTMCEAGMPVLSDARLRISRDRSVAIPIKSQTTSAASACVPRNTIAFALSGSRMPVASRS